MAAVDNVRHLDFVGVHLDLEASLGAKVIYRERFWNKLDEPYRGDLESDLLAVHSASREKLTDRVLVDADGEFVLDDDGRYLHDDNGVEVEVDNPDYKGVDIVAVLRIAWAMARAVDESKGTPYEGGFDELMSEVMHAPMSVTDEASLFSAVVYELGGGVIFRRPAGQGGAHEPDEEKQKR